MQTVLVGILLSGIGRDALKVAAGLAVAVLLSLAFSLSSVMALFSVAVPISAVAGAHVEEIPADQLAVMRDAAATCGLPWQVLAGIAKVESDYGRNMATSSAGAIGYGQFLPSSWSAYGRGGDPYSYHDALPAMARYLCDNGGPQHLRQAVFAYNHADWYVNQVMAVATRYGYLAPGTPSTRVLDVARSQLGMPYVWGGASPQTSFDCSGLMQWSYSQIGITIPRTAQAQYDATARVPMDQLQPGDLVYFAATYPSVDVITHVGIYVGNGMMINAPTTGDVIRELPVFTGYWGAHYAGAGRVG